MKKQHQRDKKRKYSAYKVAIAIVLTLFLLLIGNKAYELYVLHQAIVNAEQIKQQLIEEKNMLEQKKTDLNDPKVIEDKARHELGLVKPGEVPYVP